MTIRRTLLAVLPLLALAGVAAAQTTVPVEVEIGYRIANISGNENLYRTQINEREGFVLRSLTFFTSAKAADHFRLDATDIGATPAGAIRIDTGRADSYRLRFGYRTFDSFNSLPAFANPVLGQGITPGQHTWDRTRTMFDADLELLSLGKFTPFVGYSYARNEGPGTMSYFLGQDEFLLGSNLNETDREFRVGTSFVVGKVTGSITQGWRGLKSSEELSLSEGAGAGNNPGSILGTPIKATTISRVSKTEVDTPFTSAYVMADVLPRVKFIGDFVRFAADATGDELESATGSFVSFEISRYFNGLTETTTSRAKNDTWRGNARAEVTLTDTVTFQAGYRSEHRELQGTGLVNSLYQDTLTFGGLDPRNIQEILFSDNVLNRDEDVLSATISARKVGPFSVRAGYSVAKQDYNIAPDLAEIVVPGSQSGDFARSVKTFDVNANYAQKLFSLGASWRRDNADEAVLRTDFIDRNRLRLRATFHTPGNMFRAGVTADNTNQSSDRLESGFTAHGKQYIADLEVAPITPLRLRGSYSQFKADSFVVTRRPETFAPDTSVYREDGTSIEGGVGLVLDKFNGDATVSRFENEGSIPFTMNRIRLRAGYDAFTHAGVVVEWSKDRYQETAAFGQYDAKRVGLFLRLRP
jgi:hypothetical protein